MYVMWTIVCEMHVDMLTCVRASIPFSANKTRVKYTRATVTSANPVIAKNVENNALTVSSVRPPKSLHQSM